MCRNMPGHNHDEDGSCHELVKKKPLVVSGFEFVLMGSDGALSKKGISQIRAHTTRELHRTRRENGQVRIYSHMLVSSVRVSKLT